MSERAVVDPAYIELLSSDRVSGRTRAVLLDRLQAPSADAVDGALTARELAVLGAVLARVVPQRDGGGIDLAARVGAALGAGDGWRFASLPPDREAYRAGLATLDAAANGFCTLSADTQDALLARAATGDLQVKFGLDAGQMRRWFEDVRADAVKAYVAHPATLARMGYSGVAHGGDGPRLPGFVRLKLGEREDWEPVAAVDIAP